MIHSKIGQPVRREYLQTVIVRIGHVNFIIRRGCDAPGRRELSRRDARSAVNRNGFALDVQHLNPIVAVFGDVESAFRVQRQIVGIIEFARPVADAPPRLKVISFGAEHLNTMVARIGDDDPAISGADGGIGAWDARIFLCPPTRWARGRVRA